MVDVYLVFALTQSVQNQLETSTDGYRKRESHGVKNPRNIIIRDCENGFTGLSEFVQVRKGMDGLVESAGESTEDYDVVLRLRSSSAEPPDVGVDGAYPVRPGL